MTARLPWDINGAYDADLEASKAQRDHQEDMRKAYDRFAKAQQEYRVRLAYQIAALRDKGHAASLCERLARGDHEIARLEAEMTRADGDREVAIQEGWRLNATRRRVENLTKWSMRKDGDEPEGPYENVTPRRAE